MIAFGMMLLFEGITPFLFPARWRRFLEQVARLSDGQIRFLGLTALLLGLAVIWLVRF